VSWKWSSDHRYYIFSSTFPCFISILLFEKKTASHNSTLIAAAYMMSGYAKALFTVDACVDYCNADSIVAAAAQLQVGQ